MEKVKLETDLPWKCTEGKRPTRPSHVSLESFKQGPAIHTSRNQLRENFRGGQLSDACLNTEARPEEDAEEVPKSRNHDSHLPTPTKALVFHSSHEIGTLTWSDFY